MLRTVFCLFLLGVSASAKNWEPDCDGDEFRGVCVEPRRCFSTNPYIAGLVYPKPCTTKEGRVGVCCTDCELVHNANDAILDRDWKTGLLWKTGQKSWDNCIEYLQRYKYYDCNLRSSMRREATQQQCHENVGQGFVTYVSGGIDASRGEYPHMALLGFRDSEDPSSWLCSGALISERYILTAAHCLESRYLGPVTEAAFGILKRSDPPKYWHRYKIRRSIPHPKYKEPSKYHDIALLETEIPVTFINMSVLPACLPAYDAAIPYESPTAGITATGWGNLGYLQDVADTMQKVVLSKFSEAECDSQFPPQRRLLRTGLDHGTQMCFGDKKLVRDTCKGDSGGALQLADRPSCINTLIGVTSYGSECGFLGQGGVYTKIAAYLPWIESVVWP